MRPAVALILAALVLPLTSSSSAAPLVSAAPSPCLVQEGQAIGAIRIGMDQAEMLRVMGSPTGQVVGGQPLETIYLFAASVAQVTVVGGQVRRIATRDPSCATSQGVRIGDSEARVRAAYDRAIGSARAQTAGLIRLVFPFNGIEFIFTGGKVSLMEVFRAEALPLAAPRATSTAAAAAAGVTIHSVTGQLEGTAFVVSGSISNSGDPIAVFAQIVLLGADGRRLAESAGTVLPNPVSPNRVGNFQERIAVNDVVARFTVTVRAMDPPNRVLAETTQEVKDVAQFSGMLDRLIEVTVLSPTAGRPSGTVLAVTNRSAFRISGLVLALDMRGVCRNEVQPPVIPGLPTPAPTFTRFVVTRKATAQVPVLAPNARVEVELGLGDRGPCVGMNAQWTVTWRVTAGKVEAESK